MQTGSIIGTNIDWLAYTVDWPFDEVISTSIVHKFDPKLDANGNPMFRNHEPIGVHKSYPQTDVYREHYGRSTVGYVTKHQLERVLQSVLPEIIIKKLKITIDHKDKKVKMKNYDTVRELQSYDTKSDKLEVVGHIGWHSRNASMGIHVVMRGDHLSVLRGRGIKESKFMALLLALGARVSRLDLALDIETETKPREIYDAVASGDIKLGKYKPATKWDIREDQDGGQTAYLGSKSSEKWFRLYDKKIETKSEDNPDGWLRLEAVLRDDTAKVWAKAVAEHSVLVAIKALTHNYFDGWSDLNTWLTKVKSIDPITVPPKKKASTEKWLMTVALKAVIDKLSDYDADLDNMERALREALTNRSVELAYRLAVAA